MQNLDAQPSTPCIIWVRCFLCYACKVNHLLASSDLKIFFGTQFIGSSGAHGSILFSKLMLSCVYLSVVGVEILNLFPPCLHLPSRSSIFSLAGEMEQMHASIRSWLSLCLSTKLCALFNFLISVSTSFNKDSFLETAKHERPIEADYIMCSTGLNFYFPGVFCANIAPTNSKLTTIMVATNITLDEVLFWSVLPSACFMLIFLFKPNQMNNYQLICNTKL